MLKDQGIAIIVDRLPYLRKLALFGCLQITDRCSAQLRELKFLEDFTVSACPRFTCEGFKMCLPTMTELRSLNISSMEHVDSRVLLYLKFATKVWSRLLSLFSLVSFFGFFLWFLWFLS